MDKGPAAPRFDDRLKASVAVVANLIFLVAVVGLWLLEAPLFHRHQLSKGALIIFIVGSLSLIVYYGLHVASDNVRASIELLMEAARTGVSGCDRKGSQKEGGALSLARWLATNLWIPVVLNFWLVGWLIYASGGLTNSPYSQVPIAMILVGQSVYDVPPIRLTSGSTSPRLVRFGWTVARLYWLSLVVVITLIAGLVIAQAAHPWTTRAAPTGEAVALMLVSLFASMCVTFVTRRTDQRRRR